MAEENTPVAGTPTPVATTVTPAVVETTSVAATPTPEVTPTVTPAAAPAAVVTEPVKAETPAPVVVEPVKATTLLGGEKKDAPAPVAKAPDGTPADASTKTSEGEKPAEATKVESQSVEPAPLPTYESWTLPEGVTLDNEKATEFTKLLGTFQQSAKVEQTAVQQFGQQLVDYHIAQVKESLDRQAKSYNDTWDKTKNDWKEAVVKDPELGGNRLETTLNAALAARDLGASVSKDPKVAAAQRAEMVKLMETGIGNHPAVIRTLANLNGIIEGYKAKYESESVKPLANVKPVPEKKTKTQTLYGKTA